MTRREKVWAIVSQQERGELTKAEALKAITDLGVEIGNAKEILSDGDCIAVDVTHKAHEPHN